MINLAYFLTLVEDNRNDRGIKTAPIMAWIKKSPPPRLYKFMTTMMIAVRKYILKLSKSSLCDDSRFSFLLAKKIKIRKTMLTTAENGQDCSALTRFHVNSPQTKSPRLISPRTIPPEVNSPWGKISPPVKSLPDNSPQDTFPPVYNKLPTKYEICISSNLFFSIYKFWRSVCVKHVWWCQSYLTWYTSQKFYFRLIHFFITPNDLIMVTIIFRMVTCR